MTPEIIQAFAHALENRGEGVSVHTVRSYVSDLAKFAEWFRLSTGEPMEPQHVTPVDIRDYKEHLQVVKKFKPATINRRLATLRVFFGWAIQEKLIDENPVAVRNLKEPRTAPRALDERTYSRLLRAVQRHGSKRDVAIIQVLRHTGLRVGELCNLELTDLVISERKGKVIVRSGKGGEYDEVPLNLDARKALQEYLAERPQVNVPQVFIGQRKNGLTDAAVQEIVSKYARLANLEEVSPHVLRHTFGRSLIDRDVDLPTVQKLMRHKRIDSTARYTKPSQKDLEDAVERLAIEEM